MRLITAHELAQKGERELAALFRRACADLAQTEPCSDDRRTALASLENVRRALALKRAAPRP